MAATASSACVANRAGEYCVRTTSWTSSSGAPAIIAARALPAPEQAGIPWPFCALRWFRVWQGRGRGLQAVGGTYEAGADEHGACGQAAVQKPLGYRPDQRLAVLSEAHHPRPLLFHHQRLAKVRQQLREELLQPIGRSVAADRVVVARP